MSLNAITSKNHSMKIAFLILCHEQPKHFHRLIRALDSEHFYFFVHVDLKSPVQEFIADDFGPNVIFIKNRTQLFHGGFSILPAMINLLRAASKTEDFSYFFFLSGRDYPIKPPEHINNFLTRHYPLNFIDYYPLLGNAHDSTNLWKYHFDDLIGYPPRPIKKFLKMGQQFLSKLVPDRTFIKGMVPYRGSAWFCLNRPTVNYILEFLGSPVGKPYITFFKHAWSPDEMFFHTIVLNSPHAEECRYYDADIYGPAAIHDSIGWRMPNKGNLHYIDWSRDREDPAILDMRDFDSLSEADFLFARKFCQNKSKELLEHIDTHLLGYDTKSRSVYGTEKNP